MIQTVAFLALTSNGIISGSAYSIIATGWFCIITTLCLLSLLGRTKNTNDFFEVGFEELPRGCCSLSEVSKKSVGTASLVNSAYSTANGYF